MDMAHELDTGGVSSSMVKKAAHAMYKYGGFKAVDRLGKNVLMQTAILRNRKLMQSYKGKEDFIKQYGKLYTKDEITQLMNDLSSDKLTDIVKQHVASQVMEMQPISRTQMPQFYLDHPGGRLLYQFRTWGLRQLDVIRNRVLRDLFSTDPARMANAAKMLPLLYVYVGMANVGLTEAQRFITGRDSKLNSPNDLGMASFWSLMSNLSMDRYSMEQAVKKGDFGAYWAQYAPPSVEIPANVGIALSKAIVAKMNGEDAKVTDQMRLAWKGMGGLARMVDFWFLGGAEEENAKLRTERERALEKRLGF